MSELVSGPAIQSGKAVGLLEFADWVVVKGYASAASWGPLKSAARQVFKTVEGSDSYDDVDVRSLDLDDYLDRFETKAKGSIKTESIQSYRSRFSRAVESYRQFLDTGQPPRAARQRAVRLAEGGEVGRTTPRRRPARSAANTAALAAAAAIHAGNHGDAGERLIDYPFPLRSGQVALLRLPLRLDRTDAERLAAFVRTLVFEAQRELTVGGDTAT